MKKLLFLFLIFSGIQIKPIDSTEDRLSPLVDELKLLIIDQFVCPDQTYEKCLKEIKNYFSLNRSFRNLAYDKPTAKKISLTLAEYWQDADNVIFKDNVYKKAIIIAAVMGTPGAINWINELIKQNQTLKLFVEFYFINSPILEENPKKAYIISKTLCLAGIDVNTLADQIDIEQDINFPTISNDTIYYSDQNGIQIYKHIDRTSDQSIQQNLIKSENMNMIHTAGTTTSPKNTALLIASYKGNLELVQFLIAVGANVNQINRECDTALHYAVYEGHIEIAKELLKNQADPNTYLTTNNYHNNILGGYHLTPLMIATIKDNRALVIFLLLNGALTDIKCPEPYYYTPLMIAANKGYENIADMLLYFKADPNIQTRDRTAADIAAKQGYKKIAQTIKKH